LDEEIGPVLRMFMGSYQHSIAGYLVTDNDADPVLLNIWKRIGKQTQKQQKEGIGTLSFYQMVQLIEARGFTPLLELPSIREKGYIEAQYESRDDPYLSLKEVYKVEMPEEEPRIYKLFESDGPEELDEMDNEVQMQLNMLLERRNREPYGTSAPYTTDQLRRAFRGFSSRN
jgi:hypothetical protein